MRQGPRPTGLGHPVVAVFTYCGPQRTRLTSPAMRTTAWRPWLLGVLIACAMSAAPVRADQGQDGMVRAPSEGKFLNLDLIYGAIQAGLEDRIPVYGKSNMLTLRASGIAALPFGSTQADAELRIVNLTLGTSVGYASVWRNQTF